MRWHLQQNKILGTSHANDLIGEPTYHDAELMEFLIAIMKHEISYLLF